MFSSKLSEEFAAELVVLFTLLKRPVYTIK